VKRDPRISATEWAIMEVLWTRSPLSSGEIVESLKGWNQRTVKAFLTRLVKKGAVGFKEQGKAYAYHPLVGRDACVRRENEAFLERIHGGALGTMFSSFLDARRLSPEEIKELKKILDEKRSET